MANELWDINWARCEETENQIDSKYRYWAQRWAVGDVKELNETVVNGLLEEHIEPLRDSEHSGYYVNFG